MATMNKIFLTIVLAGVAKLAAAQMTLQQCVDYALTNNSSVQNAVLDREITDNDDK